MTWRVIINPFTSNNFAGKVGCANCNPYQGNTDCEEERRILCIGFHKQFDKVYYDYGNPILFGTSYQDAAFYNGWTGGGVQVTEPVKGTLLTSRSEADRICES